MAVLSSQRLEAFARALAEGRSAFAACAEAGYARNWRRARERAARAEVAARVSELREAATLDETLDEAGVVATLTALARKAGAMPTAAGMSAARGLWAQAAKLKGGLRETVATTDGASPVDPRYAPLSDEDWIAKHAPRG